MLYYICNGYNMGTNNLPEIYARAWGRAVPEYKCRQIKSVHVITNISHCPCSLIAYYGWPKAVQATLNLLYRQRWEIWLWVSSKNVVATCINMNGQKWADIIIISWLLHCLRTVLHSLIKIKGVSFFVKPLSRGLWKMGMVLN